MRIRDSCHGQQGHQPALRVSTGVPGQGTVIPSTLPCLSIYLFFFLNNESGTCRYQIFSGELIHSAAISQLHRRKEKGLAPLIQYKSYAEYAQSIKLRATTALPFLCEFAAFLADWATGRKEPLPKRNHCLGQKTTLPLHPHVKQKQGTAEKSKTLWRHQLKLKTVCSYTVLHFLLLHYHITTIMLLRGFGHS